MSDANYSADDDVADGTILVVEDDEEDIFILRRALEKSPVNMNLDVAKNGKEAFEYLVNCYENRTLQDLNLILLDLNMPLVDGHSFLKQIRDDKRFATLPVVVLTTSREPEIVKQARKDGANAVVAKADTLEGMMKIVDTIIQFWLKLHKNITWTDPPSTLDQHSLQLTVRWILEFDPVISK